MSHLFSLLSGFVPTAHAAYNPTLPTWASSAPGVTNMWTTIKGTVFTNLTNYNDIVHALTSSVVNLIFTSIAGIAVLLIMYAGIRMIIGRGKDEEFTQGKTIITWAVIGLVLAMLANAVITFFAAGFLPEFLQ